MSAGQGKQLSFAYGEVSPLLQYRSSDNFYSKGLYTLYNAFVRKSGGVSNRPGMKYFVTPANQATLPDEVSPIGVRLLPFTKVDRTPYVIELRREITPAVPVGQQCPIRFFDRFGNVQDAVWGATAASTSVDYLGFPFNLDTAVITQLGDSAIITVETYSPVPGIAAGQSTTALFNIYINSSNHFEVEMTLLYPSKIGTPGAFGPLTSTGLDPSNIPVCYKVTQELQDGSEVFWQGGCFTDGHPHSQRSASLKVDVSQQEGVKQYNIYRSAGSATGTAGSSYALVGRIPPGVVNTDFQDFLTNPDITVQPPTDDYLQTDWRLIRKLVFYKERTVKAFAQFKNTATATFKYTEGQFAASKLGAPKMFGRPLTPNDIDAFSFTIPTDKSGPITNLLVLNRLVAFTDRYTFIFRGGINGVLTPTEVNPEMLYQEGCAYDVQPAASDSRGFFTTPDKSKIVMIAFERDDAYAVGDITTLSEHLFQDRNIRRMIIVTGIENVLWILKTDGTLISLTITDDGSIQGFGRHETDGFIEDICMQRADTRNYLESLEFKDAPTLFLSVIRDGIRYYEKMIIRDDSKPERYLFADNSITFGLPLLNPFAVGYFFLFNLTTTTNWLAGSNITLTDISGGTFFDSSVIGKYLDFFYELDDSTPKKLSLSKVRFKITAFTTVSGNQVLTGVAEVDVPSYLQNIQAQSLSANEKVIRQNRVLQTSNQLFGLTRWAGKQVVVFADGNVISSPNNPNKYGVLTVDNTGTLDLGGHYNWGHVGLPYESHFETLNLEAADQRTFSDKGKLINNLGMGIYRTLGGFIGPTGAETSDMEELRLNESQDIEVPIGLYSGYYTQRFPSGWESTGRVLIKQVDPLPMTILSLYPKGTIGD